MRYIDANVIIDGLIDQGTRTHTASVRLLDRIRAGTEIVSLTDLVLAEVIAILGTSRGGRFGRADIKRVLLPIVTSDGADLPNKDEWIGILDIMADYNVDAADAHLTALIQLTPDADLYSLDSDFDRIPGITRLEP
jgi:predicted nucleic acid-binding protein